MTTALGALRAGLVHCLRGHVSARRKVASVKVDGWKRDRRRSLISSWSIRVSRRANELQTPMELWAGVSSPPDFEFGYQTSHEEALEVADIEKYAGFSELKDFVVQPYMADVDMPEEEELPAKYVPPPPVPLEDVEMREKVEEVMYTLLKCLSGQMATLLEEQEKWDALLKIFGDTVEIQDPLICLKGGDSFKRLLSVLCHSGIAVNLHEVYYENIAADRSKRWVYAVWTATLTDNLEESIEKVGLTEWWAFAYGSLVNHIERQEGPRSTHAEYEVSEQTQDVGGKTRSPLKSSWDRKLKLSGESKLEVNKEGQVASVSSRWYKLAGDDDLESATSKLWFAGLYCRNGL